MILHAIELEHVGPFRETVRVGPFASGLNLLCAPNEAGKSTVLRAAARALFDKHTTKGEELKSLQPVGTDLAPRVAVEFETRAGRYRIEKTFLQAPRSLLSQWRDDDWAPVAEADAADRRMQELLHSSLPGKGATKPEHWGFLGFLWARQGELCEWPDFEDDATGQQVRARLARVELDPVIEQLRTRLAATADAVVTTTGQSRAGGPLKEAEDQLAVIEAELAKVRATRADLEAKHLRYQGAVDTVARLEKEHAERAAQAKTLAEQALAAERLRGELERRQAELVSVQEKLAAIVADAAALEQRQGEIARTRDALAGADEATKTAERGLTLAREKLDREQAARQEQELRLARLRGELQRTQGLIRLRQLTAESKLLEKQLGKAGRAAAEVARIADAKAALPAVTATKVRRLEELTELVRTQQAQLQALGLTVDLTPERPSSVVVGDGAGERSETLPGGVPTRLHSPQSLDLTLAGWGRVTIRSGAKEARDLANELAESEAGLRTALEEGGVVSLEAAREALAKRKELDAQGRIAEAAFTEQLGDHETLDSLRTSAANAAHRVEALAATLQPTPAESERGDSEIEADEAHQAAAVPAAEKALKLVDQALAQLRAEEREAGEALRKTTATAADLRTRLHTLESQVAGLVARYSDGVGPAKTRAQLEFARAEARVTAAKAGLPPDFERLPERNRRAAAALQQIVDELQAGRTERDNLRGALETLGGQGIHTCETELEEKKAETVLQRDAARARGWAARIAQTLIEHRKQAAMKAVLTPLEQRLTAAFAELTGDRARAVFLDERLRVAGVGRTRDESHAFDLLSQGAKEQLLLCLRIAVALELAAAEPQVLILDDVLVNTDGVRQERVLDALGALAATLQVLVVTCHADRYRGAGTSVAITA